MKTALSFVIAAVVGYVQMFAQVPTQTEINVSKQTEQSRPGYFFYAKPFEVTMTVNLWGEIPQQGVYVVPTTTDIVQLLSYAGGPRDRSNLDDVLIYRVSGKKDQKLRILKTINVRDILEGRSDPVLLAPGDMIVVKRIPESWTMEEWLTVINTGATLAVLGVTIYNLTKK
ncbi:MAG: hypothetical protein WBZ48_11495 [Bacteroidota bacterium]